MASHCKYCNTEIELNYCPNCGQPAKLKRIDGHFISHEIQHLLHFEKGFFYSAKELLIRPGKTIREFINDDRNKHMKPVAFLIICSLIYTIVAHYLHVDILYNQKEQISIGDSAVNNLTKWVQTHYGYSNILLGIFIAFSIRLFFKKHKYNLFEITVAICFIFGEGMLLLTLQALFVNILSVKVFIWIMTLISLGYTTWAIGQLIGSNTVVSYIKAFFSYLFGYLMFYITLVIIGLLVDLFIK